MDYRPLVKGCITNFGIFIEVLEFLRFGHFFLFFKKIRFWGFLVPPYCGIGATIRIGREMLCLRYVGFFFTVMATRLGPSPQSSTPCQQTFPCCAPRLVWLVLGARELSLWFAWHCGLGRFPYGSRGR